MRTEINPQETTRATAFELWMSSPMPMVTLVKTLDVSHMIKYCRRNHLSFNMMMCWCIGKAASQIPEFFSLPQDDKMYRFSRLAIGPVVANSEGGINYCDIPYSDSIQQFSADYRSICSKAAAMCENICLDKEMMVIATSAMIETELDCIVNQYAKGFNNPMVMWGRYHEAIVPSLSHSWFRTTLAVSFQFHHVQMDGGQGALFLRLLQQEMDAL